MINETIFNTFAERLQHIIKVFGFEKNKKGFAKKCGISGNQIYNYADGSQEPGTKFYRGLKESYPEVSIDWLISGQGRPFIEGQLDNVVELKHEQVIREFKDKDFALELNQALVALEKRSLKEFYKVGGYITGLVDQPERRREDVGPPDGMEERRRALGED